MKYKHYSPDCKTMLFYSSELSEAVKAYREESGKALKVYLLCDDATAKKSGVENILNLGRTEIEIASNLYSKLREGEKISDLIIAVAPEKQDGVMVGVMNRLTKACR